MLGDAVRATYRHCVGLAIALTVGIISWSYSGLIQHGFAIDV